MSVEQLEQQIERLPGEELAQFALWFDDFLGRSLGDDGNGSFELENLEQEELLRRRDDLLANPALAQPMDERYFSDLKRELADFSF